MEKTLKRLVENVIHYRKRLVEVESKRGEYDRNVPAQIWQELTEVSHFLELAENKVRLTTKELAGDINQVRENVIASLEKYNVWREQMFKVEKLFLVNIVRPGYQLKKAIKQREYLQGEYERINNSISREGYSNEDDLKTDIRRTLSFSENGFSTENDEIDENSVETEYMVETIDEINPDTLVDAFSREELIKEFKRVVLPKVHPDTSDTTSEVFKTVFEVYQKQDPLLMEAYIVEYKGEIQFDDDADLLESMDLMLKVRERYQKLFGHLKRRIEQLFQKMTAQELEDPQKLQEKMVRQREEIIGRIQSEGEQIIYWREKIENLMQIYHDQHKPLNRDQNE